MFSSRLWIRLMASGGVVDGKNMPISRDLDR